MKFDMIRDLSAITGIKLATLQSVLEKQNKLIAHDLFQLSQEDSVAEIDIGIGTLQIKVDGENCFYRFVPCAKLQGTISHTLQSKEDVLVSALEKAVADRFEKTYKEII